MKLEPDSCGALSGMDPAAIRVLRRLDLAAGSTDQGETDIAGFGVAVDVRTTGRDVGQNVVIELAARRFSYDRHHVITRLDRMYVWRQDAAATPIAPGSGCAGPYDDGTTSSAIDVREATRVLGSATLRIAHDAGFDRPFVDALLPGLQGLPWACSVRDVDWVANGIETAGLGWMLAQCGYFRSGRDAADDVDAVIQILRESLGAGQPALSLLMENACRHGWMVRAFGARYESREQLRSRGYRWCPSERVWLREIAEPERESEAEWLSSNVYGSGRHGNAADFEYMDWTVRYAR